jgi:ribosome assembly protein 3
MADDSTSAEFASFYLQQATREFAEDLDKVRTADDFKPDSVALLVQALQQGTALFQTSDQERVASKGADGSKTSGTS